MLIRLPKEKADEWDNELRELIKLGDDGWRIGLKRLETIQGRNINVANIVPAAMHFHSRMYGAIDRAKLRPKLEKGAKPTTRLRAEERRDLRLHRHLLTVARRGVSLNNVIIREPDHVGRSDAFEGGIGGFDLTSGRAWRWAIPIELQHRKSQNFLEYLACMTQLVCMLRETDWKSGDCFMSVGDNTSALGWIHKSNFKPEKFPEQATHLALARHITLLLAELDVVQCGQWLPGSDNGVADALSRQQEPTDNELTDLIVASFPTQTPNGFRISPLPPEIISWVRYWEQHTHETKASPPEPLQSETRRGSVGSSSCTNVNSQTISISRNSPHTSDTSSLGHLRNESETMNGPDLRRDMITWLREHAAPPLIMCVRPSSQPVMTTPAKIRMDNLRSFYDGN
jgi:hypothetical protein